jgi:hypothetical protein
MAIVPNIPAAMMKVLKIDAVVYAQKMKLRLTPIRIEYNT